MDSPASPPMKQAAASGHQVNKCVQAGKVTYSDAPCPQAVPDRMAECKALDTLITQIDAEARQPLSGARQDWLRERKKVARDRQFELRCQ